MKRNRFRRPQIETLENRTLFAGLTHSPPPLESQHLHYNLIVQQERYGISLTQHVYRIDDLVEADDPDTRDSLDQDDDLQSR